MKRTRNLRCKDKRPYNTRPEAQAAMKSFQRRQFGGIETNASVYPCGDHFHWGHYRNRKR